VDPSCLGLALLACLAYASALHNPFFQLKEQPLDLESVLYMARSYAELEAMDDARSLASQLDRWALPADTSFQLALAELHRAVGWSARACAEYERLRLALRDHQAANADRLRLEASCAKAR
jgi:hypothetical protein